MVPDDIYWQDGFAWAEQQAGLLQRLAHGERVNAEIDWEHVVEEVRDVGLSELRTVESLLTRALEHLLKLNAWPGALPTNHWQVELVTFLAEAQNRCTPSMRARIDVAACYRRALRPLSRMRIDNLPPPVLRPACCFILDDLLPPGDAEPDPTRLLEILAAASAQTEA
jgi:hypothetical protein